VTVYAIAELKFTGPGRHAGANTVVLLIEGLK
jgi:hypothetical protein